MEGMAPTQGESTNGEPGAAGVGPTTDGSVTPDAAPNPTPAPPPDPDLRAGLRRRCRQVAIGGAGVFTVLLVVVMIRPAPGQFERDLGRLVRRLTFLRDWRHLRDLGDPLVVVADIGWIAVLSTLARRLRLALVCLGGALATILLTDVVLQPIVVRPGVVARDGTRPPDFFPSSHVVAMCAVTAAAVMIIGLGGGSRRLTRVAAALAAIQSGLVAWASVYLGAHYAFDVLASVALAAAGMAVTLEAALRWGVIPSEPSHT